MLVRLNSQQKKAVTTVDKHVLLLAGAGSGKTSCLTYRINYLVEQGYAKIGNILGVTFTNKAANEMKQRLKEMMGSDVKYLWLGTFHSICVRILKMFGDDIGLAKTFSIYDEEDSLKLIKEILKKIGMNNNRINRDVLSTISYWKTEMRSPRDVQQARQLMSNEFDQICADVYEEYQNKLKRSNAIDFDDIILLTIKLLNYSTKTRDWAHKKFKYILVDEYQDSNLAQYTLIQKLLSNKANLFVVGDPDQGIYSWRGADINIILNFQRDYPDAEVIALEENYRSHQVIVEAAEAVIQNNIQRIKKHSFTSKKDGPKIELYTAQDEYEEARWIVSTIEYLTHYEGVDYKNIAILNRTNFQTRAIEMCLVEKGIPYKMASGLNFFDRKEVKDTMAFINLALNPYDTVNFTRAFLLFPKCGEVTAQKIVQYARNNNVDLISSLAAGSNTARQLDSMFREIQRKQFSLLPSEYLEFIWDTTGYVNMLLDDQSKKGRIANLDILHQIANQYDNLDDFLAMTALASVNDEDSGDVVKVMTVHSAKGLEFEIVFLAGMEEGQFPHKNNLYDPVQLEEERRLAYVGITRTIDRLYISWSQNRQRFGIVNPYNTLSRFISEIPQELIEQPVQAYS